MSDLQWTMIAVGVGLATIIIIAADSIEKRLSRIIRLLECINDNTYDEGKLARRYGLDD